MGKQRNVLAGLDARHLCACVDIPHRYEAVRIGTHELGVANKRDFVDGPGVRMQVPLQIPIVSEGTKK